MVNTRKFLISTLYNVDCALINYLRGSVLPCIVEILSTFPFSIPEQFTFSSLKIDERTASNNLARMWKIISAATDVRHKEIIDPITTRAAMSIGKGDVVELSVKNIIGEILGYFDKNFGNLNV